MPYNRWTREQALAVFYIRLEHKERLTLTHPDVCMLAKAMNRSKNSIRALKCNFDFLDYSVLGGWSNCANLTKEIWAEYEQNPDGIRAEGRRAYLNFKRQSGG